MATDPAGPILLYDGVCGLCNRLVRFVLRRDSRGRLRFASLQSDFAARILRRHGFDPHDLDTHYVIENGGQPRETLCARSDAVIAVLRRIGGLCGALAALLHVFPKWLRDWGYNLVARHRYRTFGKYDSCLLP